MTDSEIYLALNEVFRDVFDDDTISVSAETTAADVEGWDSQAHISLIVAAEMRFGVRFRTGELEKLHNLGELVQTISKQLGR